MKDQRPEAAAKAALLNHLRSGEAWRGHAVISELAVDQWARRADVVTVSSELVAYEIKTAADRLTRLDQQIAAYARVCDRVYAVVASKHMNAAMSRLPAHVGLKELATFRGRLQVIDVREADLSPEIDLSSTIRIMPVRDLARLAKSQSVMALSRRRSDLECCIEAVDFAATRSHLRKYLFERHKSATDALKRGVSGRRIIASDLGHLSVWRNDPKEVDTRVEASPIAVWFAELIATEAFGSIPDDVRALLK